MGKVVAQDGLELAGPIYSFSGVVSDCLVRGAMPLPPNDCAWGKNISTPNGSLKMNGAAAAAAAVQSLQSCPTLCDPIDGSPPGSPIPGILQARTLEWVAIAFSMNEAGIS